MAFKKPAARVIPRKPVATAAAAPKPAAKKKAEGFEGFTVNMMLTKSTPGTHLYTEIDENENPLKGDEGTFVTSYIRKVAFGEGVTPPDFIHFTVAAGKAD